MAYVLKNNTKRSILSGFSVVIILVLLLASIIISRVSVLKNRFESIAENQLVKIELANIMRESIRLRRISMHKMLLFDDPFERDEELLRFYEHAGAYRNAREKLVTFDRDATEKTIHEKLREQTRESQPITRQLAELINDNSTTVEFRQRLEVAFSNQDKVLALLDELVKHQKTSSSSTVEKARSEYESMFTFTLVMSSIIIVIIFAIAFIVSRYVTRKNTELANATRAKSSFLATMSHEIRTPLTSIIGFGETLLENRERDPAERKSVNSIIRNGKHLLDIISDILDFSKIEAGKIELEHVDVSLFELTRDVAAVVEPQAINKGLAFKVEYKFPVPDSITTDPIRLKQILINITGNAIKFTENGYVSLIIKYDQQSNMISFNISDTGIGMSTEQQEKIFSPFRQADSSTTRRFGGTGLGLHLSREFTQMLGGEINVSSKLYTGSQFIVSIPAGNINHLVNSTPTITSDPDKHATSNPYTRLTGSVLLAEDNIDNQRLIEMYVSRTGASIDIVENGLLALEKAQTKSYDLILMDKQMPIMDGMDAVRELRKSGYDGTIVALTANATQQDKDECLDAGCNGFLSKPVQKERLMATLMQYVNHADAEINRKSGPGENIKFA